ncbi:transposase [Bacteroides ovatus]|nr:transposase [Bacteroides ovatus]
MKWRLVDNGEKAVITAPMPLMPIYKGMPGASMLAEVLLQKYEYHVPFYRQVKQLEHLGVKLSKNTLDGWFRPVCELLSTHFIWNSGRKYWYRRLLPG